MTDRPALRRTLLSGALVTAPLTALAVAWAAPAAEAPASGPGQAARSVDLATINLIHDVDLARPR